MLDNETQSAMASYFPGVEHFIDDDQKRRAAVNTWLTMNADAKPISIIRQVKKVACAGTVVLYRERYSIEWP